MSYQNNVRAAIAALNTIAAGDDANWTLARLTYEVCGPSGQGRKVQPMTSLAQWSADIMAGGAKKNFSPTSASYYRRIWELFGEKYHSGDISDFTQAYNDMRGVANMDANMVSTNFNRALEYATPQQKQAVFQQLVRDEPAVVEQAWHDTATNVALSEARWKARDEMLEPQREAVRETREIFEPKDTALDRRNLLASIATKVDLWTRELNGIRDILEYTDDVDWGRLWATRQALDRLVQAATICRDTLPSSAVPPAEQPGHSARRRQRLNA